MNYRITITRTEPNPAYAAQVEEMEKTEGTRAIVSTKQVRVLK
jgi:hypothetical protein